MFVNLIIGCTDTSSNAAHYTHVSIARAAANELLWRGVLTSSFDQ